MKVSLYCAHCLLQRAVHQAHLATSDPELRMRIVQAMTEFLSTHFNGDAVPSHIGTGRDLLVQRMTGKDPYADLKRFSNEITLSLFPDIQAMIDAVNDDSLRFRRAALVAAVANSIEFDVAGRSFNLAELKGLIERVESELAIDHIEEFRRLCMEVDEVLYLMDNAGEIVLDMVLIREIKRLGPRVIAVVKSGPVLNDATLEDAEAVRLDSCADVVMSMGCPAIGINIGQSSEEFRRVFFSAKLIVAKGMGNYESLTEFEPHCPVVHLLRTKCLPVAEHVGVPRNRNVILVRRPKTA